MTGNTDTKAVEETVMRNTIGSALLLVALSMLGSTPLTHGARAGEGFFQKIGDGWRKGKWVPGLPDVKPQTWQEVVFPICWGSPQDCRGEAQQTASKQGVPPPPLYSVTFRVDCIDADNGRDRGDSTTTFTSSKSEDDARQAAVNAYKSSDLCQYDPNYRDRSRITRTGSGRFI
jgi:hypothetical protein